MDKKRQEVLEADGNNRKEGEKAVSGVGEWAKHSINIQDGCPHTCLYCYAACMSIRFGRSTPVTWRVPRVRQDALDKEYRKKSGKIMMPTSHDITPDNLADFLLVLLKVLRAGNEVLIVSKPHLECIKAVCAATKDFKKQILFRFSIGSADSKILKAWEPGAPDFKERVAALKWAYEQGFDTSVSAEPMLDKNIDQVIEKCRAYVTDAIWLGRVNRLRQILAINCPEDKKTLAMGERLIEEMSDDYLRSLYNRYQKDTMIKYKESIKKVVGLVRPKERGLDV